MAIRFMKHYVTDGQVKARVFYTRGQRYVKQPDGSRVLRDGVSIYAKDYGRTLRQFPALMAENGTDISTDYIEQDSAFLLPEHPMHAAALARCAA